MLSEEKNKKPLIALAVIALIVAAVVVAVYAGSSASNAILRDGSVWGDSTQEQKLETQIMLSFEAAGWDQETSTPVIVCFESEEAKNYYPLSADEAHAIKLNSGTYTMSFISPLNEDGSTYKVKDSIVSNVTEGQIANNLQLFIPFEFIAADKITDEQRNELQKEIRAARSAASDNSIGNQADIETDGKAEEGHEHKWTNHPPQYSYEINENTNDEITLTITANTAYESCYCGAVKAA